MTHAIFTPDGASLLYADVFGLTRVTPGKTVKVKHTAKVSEARGALSVNASGTLALVLGRVHTGAHGGRALATVGLPALGLRDKLGGEFYERALVTTAAGDRVLTWASGEELRVQSLEGGALRDDRAVDLASKRARELPAQTVGPQAPSDARGTGLHALPDGRFVVRTHLAVYAGRVGADGAGDEVWWSMPLETHPSAEVTFAIEGETVWVFVRDASADLARACVVARDGATRAMELASLAAPAIDGDVILTQPASGTVVARTLSTGAEQSYDVSAWNAHPADAPEAAAFPRGVPPPPTRLPGTLALRGASRWFVPWHGEFAVDLARNASHARGLDAGAGPFRRLLVERFAALNESLRALHVEAQLLAFEKHPSAPRVTLASWLPPLPGDLSGYAAQSLVLSLWSRYKLGTHGYHWGSFGSEGGHLAHARTAPVGEVRALLAWMRAHDWLPTDLASFVADRFHGGMGIPSEPNPRAFPFDDVGERLFVRAMLETIAAGAWPEGPVADAWGAEPVTSSMARAALDRLPAYERAHDHNTGHMIAKSLAKHLGPGALPALAVMFSHGARRATVYDQMRAAGEGITWLVHHHPALRDEALAAIDAVAAEPGSATDIALTRERVARGARHFWSNA